MPLNHLPSSIARRSEDHSLAFDMQDRSTGLTVEILVDGIALEDMANEDGRDHLDLELLFSFYRSRIEEIASDKYDHDDWDGSRVVVDASDI